MKCILFFIVMLMMQWVHAQDALNAVVTGQIVDVTDEKELGQINVFIPSINALAITNAFGVFSFDSVKYGSYVMLVGHDNIFTDTFKILVDTSFINLGKIRVKDYPKGLNDSAGLNVVDAMINSGTFLDDEDMNNENVATILSTSKNPYPAGVSLNFGAFRFQPRGYGSDQLEIYLNGIFMNDISTGSAYQGQWDGLNESFRNKNSQYGLQSSENGFGGLSGSSSIQAIALDLQQQTRISYTNTNKSFRNRLAISHSSGLMHGGWAYAISLSKRWAKEGYIPGTSFNSYSFYAGLSKKLSFVSALHFTTFGSPTVSGKASPATLETMELANTHFYNPNWGYQEGEKRNAKMNHSFQPTFMLNYVYTPDSATILGFVLSYQTGYNGNSALDWYNAQDPRPDYYKNLPSYYENDEQTADSATAAAYRQKWMSDESVRQVNWDAMYAANYASIDSMNGTTGKRSVYMVGEDRSEIRKYSFAANFKKTLSEKMRFNAGLTFINQQTESYKRMIDLLGGDYYVNLNQFAERTYPGNSIFNQNDLNNPNGIIRVGDKYTYDYKADFVKSWLWTQLIYKLEKFVFFTAVRIGYDAFQREGLYKNGLFVDDSYGKSSKQSFFHYQLKGGLSYIVGKYSYAFLNTAIITTPPTFGNTFISPRTRNSNVSMPKSVRTTSLEFGYKFHNRRFNGVLSLFASESKDATEILRFYHEDYRTFVNYVMQKVSIRNTGAELALEAKISTSISATIIAAWTQVFYTSNPEISIYKDNDTAKNVAHSISYLNNTYVDAGPQSAYSFGLKYLSKKYWYANINFNFVDRNYIAVNPSRRTEEAVRLLPKGSAQWHAIVDQEVLPAAFSVDLYVGKTIRLNKSINWLPQGTFLNINVGVNNLLNNKNIQTAGFEQLRFDIQGGNPERFPTKYIYGLGTNYFINLSLKF